MEEEKFSDNVLMVYVLILLALLSNSATAAVPGPILGPGGISGKQFNAIKNREIGRFYRWINSGGNLGGLEAMLAHSPRSRNIIDQRGVRGQHAIYYRTAR